MHLRRLFPLILLFAVLLAPRASAHVPAFGGGGDSPDTAPHLHEPLKSWVIYDELHEGGEAHYYMVEMEEGQRLYVSLFTPEDDFTPGLVVMGPGIAASGTVPAYVNVPSGSNAAVMQGERDGAEYEPFTPASYYFLAEFDSNLNESGDYHIAVFEPDSGGRYGIAIGYIESFTLDEWVRVPVDALMIHTWEGQSPVVILAPLIVTVIVGLVLLLWMRERGLEIESNQYWRWLGLFAALLYIGTAFMMLLQMVFALSLSGADASAGVTVMFFIIPLLLGIGILRIVLRSDWPSRNNRVFLIVLGVAGVFAWAGLIIGPILAVVAGVLPAKKTAGNSEEEGVDRDVGEAPANAEELV